MLVFPNAKINIGLQVLSKRDDGYHNISSVFYPIGLCDALEVSAPSADHTQLFFHGLPIEGNWDQNLVFKAWEILRADFGIGPVDFHLAKHIPTGGGIGGGSADGAFALKILNAWYALGLDNQALREYALKLGSDCPFFIDNVPTLVEGRGEKLKPLDPFLKNHFLVLMYGGMHISTAEAYQGIKPYYPGVGIADLIKQPVETWKDELRNDFEEVVFKKYSSMKVLKEQLYASGALYASLSGTGSCLYAIYKEEPNLSPALLDKVVWQGRL